ncbi:programmed cell death protein 7 [Callorhinchus milii]|uniref:programmed cell death protein 7 n=1 Tax=Callorhinchus milii TaxID=7868 RepID=UPI001C3FCE6B|nr:programmed cell death protein 7 [Callorhinchus milii]
MDRGGYRPPPPGPGRGYFGRGGVESPGPAYPHLRPGRDRAEEARTPPPPFGPWGLEQRDFPRPLWERPPLSAGAERYPPPPPPPPQGQEAGRYHPCQEQPPPLPPHHLGLQPLEAGPQEQQQQQQRPFRDHPPPQHQPFPGRAAENGGPHRVDGPGPRQLHPADHGRGDPGGAFPHAYGELPPWSDEPGPRRAGAGGGGGSSSCEAPPAWWPAAGTLSGRPPPAGSPEGPEDPSERARLWLSRVLSRRRLRPPEPRGPPEPGPSVAEARESILGVCRLTAELTALCRRLRQSVEDDAAWAETHREALELKEALEAELRPLTDAGYVAAVRRRLGRIETRRSRARRKKEELGLEGRERGERAAEREAGIDEWRAKRVRQVEEKKKERELKAAADSVLAEVRKKQADAKRILDILCALEKLRKLRKEAAARKAVHPPPSSDEIFQLHVEGLRKMIKKRSELYDAEERALRVMLEGEQEEERKRERENKLKKQREKLEEQQREVEFIMFGDPELPSNHPLRPFRQYYLQAEHSPHVLVQIRQEWDRYLVPEDHPDGSFVPHGWVFPVPPSHDTWATALGQSESW